MAIGLELLLSPGLIRGLLLVPFEIVLQPVELGYSGGGFSLFYLVVERLWHMFTLIVKLEAPALAAWLKFWPVGLIGAGLILLIGRMWENRLGSASPVARGERNGR